MWPSALLLGDSQTQLGWTEGGWVSLLADKYVRRLDIINRGLSGYNTRMLLAVLPDILAQVDPAKCKIVTLMIGSNDASFPETNPSQAVPLEEFGENLLKIISMLLNKGFKKETLVLISPPPISPEKWARHQADRPGPAYQNCKDNELNKKFALECGAVANRLGVIFVDLFTAIMKRTKLDIALSDGLHLGREGHRILCELLMEVIDNKLGDGNRLKLPEWRDMDNTGLKQCQVSYEEWKKENPDRL